MINRQVTLLAALGSLLLVACGDGSTSEVEEDRLGGRRSNLSGSATPLMTEEGCQETPGCWNGQLFDGRIAGNIAPAFTLTPDPSPSAAGTWAGVRDTDCYTMMPGGNPQALDADLDRLWDECEYRLAYLFAPVLMMSAADRCPGGEPYWSARYFDNYDPSTGLNGWGRFVRIAYLPSYYSDCGSGSHPGDSEMITVQVTFNPNTGHWHFMKMFLTAHFLRPNSNSIWHTPVSLSFPTGDTLDYARVWISTDKHANYPSPGCGSLVNMTADECSSPFEAGRFKVLPSHNIGGRTWQFLDCVNSVNPSYWENERQECFHSIVEFGGWQTVTAERATPYAVVMHTYGYECFAYDFLNPNRCYWGAAGSNN